jgi:hypothetical protein
LRDSGPGRFRAARKRRRRRDYPDARGEQVPRQQNGRSSTGIGGKTGETPNELSLRRERRSVYHRVDAIIIAKDGLVLNWSQKSAALVRGDNRDAVQLVQIFARLDPLFSAQVDEAMLLSAQSSLDFNQFGERRVIQRMVKAQFYESPQFDDLPIPLIVQGSGAFRDGAAIVS